MPYQRPSSSRSRPTARPRPARSPFAAALLGALLAACVGPPTEAALDPRTGQPPVTGVYAPGVPTSHPPFKEFHASWKTRTDAHYVYLEQRGSYVETAAMIPSLMRELAAQGLAADGPPFALYFDDPAMTPTEDLMSRVCMPITGSRSPKSPLRYDLLPQVNVAYAVVSGPYPDAPRAYPQLFAYMDRFNWQADGPIREIYVIAPAGVRDPRDLLCEIQIPVATRR